MSAALAVACSACGAGVRQPCTRTDPGTPAGVPLPGVHQPRAVRYRNARRALHPMVGVSRGVR